METKYIAIWKATWASLKEIIRLYPKLRGRAISQVALIHELVTGHLAELKAEEILCDTQSPPSSD
jgi:hypothetical protein